MQHTQATVVRDATQPNLRIRVRVEAAAVRQRVHECLPHHRLRGLDISQVGQATPEDYVAVCAVQYCDVMPAHGEPASLLT
jgi:hypothetical protein